MPKSSKGSQNNDHKDTGHTDGENHEHDNDKDDHSRTLLGQILVELDYITIYQLDESLRIQREDKEHNREPKPLGQILLELGYCGPNQLIRAIQVQAEYRKAQAHK